MPHNEQHLLADVPWARIRRKLGAWFAKHARDLPWRNTADPYPIWISEIMLQQTTVGAVVDAYRRFLQTFPTVEALAAAHEEDVLRQWEGLGYYSRARNLHRAAKIVVDAHGGRFPREVAELVRLPGIGRYTAGAIASFAFDEPAPIVEANTLRLYSRLLGYAGDPRTAAGQRLLWEFAERVLPRKSPGRVNQALMELGALVCTPSAPQCADCPLCGECAAFAAGTQNDIPAPPPVTVPTHVTEAAVAICRRDAFLLRKRPVGERWAGLWDFPRFALHLPENGAPRKPHRARKNGAPRSSARSARTLPLPVARQLRRQIREQTGLDVELGPVVAEIAHTVTRYRIRLVCLLARETRGKLTATESLRWVPPESFGGYPLSTTGRKFANLLSDLKLDESATLQPAS